MAKRRHHVRRRWRNNSAWHEPDAVRVEASDVVAEGPLPATASGADVEADALWADDVRAWDDELQTQPDLFDEPTSPEVFVAPGAPPGQTTEYLGAPGRR